MQARFLFRCASRGEAQRPELVRIRIICHVKVFVRRGVSLLQRLEADKFPPGLAVF
ncbi:protein of unknown function [Candidatus Filomicrobium marinum]|uniref:Uncharacterized protein n=1 Tax=Candidatus Filomicrobium marinum TaxID=1608628 RepID=A0A0D6JIE0_9HYPH|nr:protein of unknown function [Candidatus Filomicrobium marinum]CPR21644.1 protein of unknown function [Candidatus Filomicrobium marinum]